DDVVAAHRGVEDRLRHVLVAAREHVGEPGDDRAARRVRHLHGRVDDRGQAGRGAHPALLRRLARLLGQDLFGACGRTATQPRCEPEDAQTDPPTDTLTGDTLTGTPAGVS